MGELTLTGLLITRLLLSRIRRCTVVNALLEWRRQLNATNLDTVAAHLHRKTVAVAKERDVVAKERDVIRADMEELAVSSQLAIQQLEAQLIAATTPTQQLQAKNTELYELQQQLIGCSRKERSELQLKVNLRFSML